MVPYTRFMPTGHQAEHEAEDATRVELLPEARPEAGALAVIAGLRGIRRSLLPAFGGVGIAAFRFRRTACRGFVEAHDGTLLGERLLGDLHRRAAFAELVLLGDPPCSMLTVYSPSAFTSKAQAPSSAVVAVASSSPPT